MVKGRALGIPAVNPVSSMERVFILLVSTNYGSPAHFCGRMVVFSVRVAMCLESSYT